MTSTSLNDTSKTKILLFDKGLNREDKHRQNLEKGNDHV